MQTTNPNSFHEEGVFSWSDTRDLGFYLKFILIVLIHDMIFSDPKSNGKKNRRNETITHSFD